MCKNASHCSSGDQAGLLSNPPPLGPVMVVRLPAFESTSSWPLETKARSPWPAHAGPLTARGPGGGGSGGPGGVTDAGAAGGTVVDVGGCEGSDCREVAPGVPEGASTMPNTAPPAAIAVTSASAAHGIALLGTRFNRHLLRRLLGCGLSAHHRPNKEPTPERPSMRSAAGSSQEPCARRRVRNLDVDHRGISPLFRLRH